MTNRELIGSGAKVEWHQNDDALDVHCRHRLQESMRTSAPPLVKGSDLTQGASSVRKNLPTHGINAHASNRDSPSIVFVTHC